MDRIAYLSTVPFLIPLQSKTWPPVVPARPPTAEDTTVVSSQCHVLLGKQTRLDNMNYNHSNSVSSKFVVSIELMPKLHLQQQQQHQQAQQGDEVGNASWGNDKTKNRIMYFATSSTNSTTTNNNNNNSNHHHHHNSKVEVLKDPTLTTVEIAVITHTIGSGSASATAGSLHQNQHQQQQQIEEVYIRFQEEYVFLFNVIDCCHCRIVYIPSSASASTSSMGNSTTATTTGSNDDGSRRVTQPQCVLLQCIHSNTQLRIFSLLKDPNHNAYHDSDTTNDEIKDVLQQLHAVFDRIIMRRYDTNTGMRQNSVLDKLRVQVVPTYRDISKEYRLSVAEDADHESPSTSVSSSSTETTINHNQQYEKVDTGKQADDSRKTEYHKPTTNEAMQQNNTNNDISIPSHTMKDSPYENTSSASHLQRHVMVKNQSLASIDTIRQILQLPLVPSSSSLITKPPPTLETLQKSDIVDDNSDNGCNQNDNVDKEDEQTPIVKYGSLLQSLLNASGKCLAQSYMLRSDREQQPNVPEEEYYNTIIRQQQHQIDSVLNAYFFIPLSSSSHQKHRQYKRRKLQHQQQQLLSNQNFTMASNATVTASTNTATTTTNIECTNTKSGPSVAILPTASTTTTNDTIADTVTNLMLEQKRIIQERYQLFLLPTRG